MASSRRSLPHVSVDAQRAATDLATLDALARIRLLARRHGLGATFHNVSAELRELAALAGLEDVLRPR